MDSIQYSTVKGVIVCLDQSPLQFARLWLTKRDYFPGQFSLKAALVTFLYLLKVRSPAPSKSISLPFSGTWCIKVRSGYKIFDVDKQYVTKVFSAETDIEWIEKEISRLKKVSCYTFTPSLIEWDANQRWYQEEFIVGKTSYDIAPEDPQQLIKSYLEYIAPCIYKLASTKIHKKKSLYEYIGRLSQDIYGSSILGSDSDSETIRKFSEAVVHQLMANADQDVFLVFSHGDFHLYNIYVTKNNSTMLIDWEGNNEQSLLNDLYNYFFSQLWLRKNNATLIKEINMAIIDLEKYYIGKSNMNAAEHVKQHPLYRWVFYLERVHSMLFAFSDSSQGISAWVRVYVEYEGNIANESIGQPCIDFQTVRSDSSKNLNSPSTPLISNR